MNHRGLNGGLPPVPESPVPVLQDTGQGVTVYYKNRYLYSRVRPDSAVSRMVSSLSIRPETLVCCFSPALDYGLEALLERLPENAAVLAVEHDTALYELALSRLPVRVRNDLRFSFIHAGSLDTVREYLASRDPGTIRRCISVDMSGGTALYPGFYHSIIPMIDEMISRFWKNRMTLVRMGRLYSRNLFRNLGRVPGSRRFMPSSVCRPILVLGAGPSLDSGLEKVLSFGDSFFIIAVDSALNPLLKRGILPDCVIALESQLANEKAFIGAAGSRIDLLADLTSRGQIIAVLGGEPTFFFSEFADTGFLRKLRSLKVLPVSIPALGSVGVAAVYLALSLRANNAPVFFAGLDFSYLPGKTHCRESPAHRMALDSADRLSPDGNPAAAYREGCFPISGKNGKRFISDPALCGYGQLFCSCFSTAAALYDLGDSGVNTGRPLCTEDEAAGIVLDWNQRHHGGGAWDRAPFMDTDDPGLARRIRELFDSEEEALLLLRRFLITGEGTPDEVLGLLENREYLYLHFPDGHKKPSADTGFLKRVRSEIDFFLKDIRIARLLLDG
ncbi:MAG: DUF115 domain-containing protein [Spirochaetaceae bacterium]|jgi:hypothetical protein|nr:DUF115 domain-containing protein [Spirochaetaceae bacterium]